MAQVLTNLSNEHRKEKIRSVFETIDELYNAIDMSINTMIPMLCESGTFSNKRRVYIEILTCGNKDTGWQEVLPRTEKVEDYRRMIDNIYSVYRPAAINVTIYYSDGRNGSPTEYGSMIYRQNGVPVRMLDGDEPQTAPDPQVFAGLGQFGGQLGAMQLQMERDRHESDKRFLDFQYKTKIEQLEKENGELKKSRDKLEAEKDSLIKENDELYAQVEELTAAQKNRVMALGLAAVTDLLKAKGFNTSGLDGVLGASAMEEMPALPSQPAEVEIEPVGHQPQYSQNVIIMAQWLDSLGNPLRDTVIEVLKLIEADNSLAQRMINFATRRPTTQVAGVTLPTMGNQPQPTAAEETENQETEDEPENEEEEMKYEAV